MLPDHQHFGPCQVAQIFTPPIYNIYQEFRCKKVAKRHLRQKQDNDIDWMLSAHSIRSLNTFASNPLNPSLSPFLNTGSVADANRIIYDFKMNEGVRMSLLSIAELQFFIMFCPCHVLLCLVVQRGRLRGFCKKKKKKPKHRNLVENAHLKEKKGQRHLYIWLKMWRGKQPLSLNGHDASEQGIDISVWIVVSILITWAEFRRLHPCYIFGTFNDTDIINE